MFINGLFTNNKDLLSQIGHILVLGNSINQANLLHWSLIKYKRIIRNVLALEFYAIIYRFNIATLIKAIIN